MFRMSEKIRRFMYGRYGNDELNYALFVLYAIIGIINLFTRRFAISVIMFAVLVIILVRALSRNVYTRLKENERFLKIWNPVKSWFKLSYNRIRDRKTNVYRRCKACKAVIRLPRKSGEHSVRCPKCGKLFKVKIR